MSYDPNSRAGQSSDSSGSSDSELSENKKAAPPSSSGYQSNSTGETPVSSGYKKVNKPNVSSYTPVESDEMGSFFEGDRGYSVDGLSNDRQPQPPKTSFPQRRGINPNGPSPFWSDDNRVVPPPKKPKSRYEFDTGQQSATVIPPPPTHVPDTTTQLRTYSPANRGFFDEPEVGTQASNELHAYADYEEETSGWRQYRSAIEWVAVVAGAVILALLIRAFLVQAFWIPSASMTDTLLIGDRILVNKFNYRVSDIARGDIVVFHNPIEDDKDKELVKRVIGLPGETVEIRDGEVLINGSAIEDEPYLPDRVKMDIPWGPETVPEGEYFMMGDNRDQSKDSRVIGTVSEDLIIGKAFVRFWPLGRIGGLD